MTKKKGVKTMNNKTELAVSGIAFILGGGEVKTDEEENKRIQEKEALQFFIDEIIGKIGERYED